MKHVRAPSLPVSNILLECIGFTWRNLGGILRRIWLPAIVGWAIFYFFFSAYMSELEDFIASPTDAHASIVLGLASVSPLLLLFIYTLTVAAVIDLVHGHGRKWGAFSIHVGNHEGRLYAAFLRLLLLMISFMAAAFLMGTGVKMAGLGHIAEYAAEVGMLVILVTISLRAGFLLAAVAMAEPHGVIIRQSWMLSAGNFWPLLLLAIAVILPGILLELLEEFVARATRLFPALKVDGTLHSYIDSFRHVAPVFSIFLSLSVMLTMVLYAIVSATVYRALMGTSPVARTDIDAR